jgi:hypothetical protein
MLSNLIGIRIKVGDVQRNVQFYGKSMPLVTRSDSSAIFKLSPTCQVVMESSNKNEQLSKGDVSLVEIVFSMNF